MIEEKRFLCERCHKSFLNKSDCINHEKTCNINVPIKRITLFFTDYNNQFNIEICTYPNATYKDGMYQLMIGNSYPMSDFDISFDQIHYNDAQKYIYTKDLSDEHEKHLIDSLIKNEMKSIDQKIKSLNLRFNYLNKRESFKTETVINKSYYYK